MALLRAETLVDALAYFMTFWEALLRTEALVDALTVFMTFWGQHGSLEDRDTCGCLSSFHVVLGATWLS